jgi:enoyl-CoA hydratase/carnithine racemase
VTGPAHLEVSRVGDHIEVWTFNRPRHNAFGGSLLRELIEASVRARDDDSVRVVITTGAGGSYAVGADLDRLAALDGASLNATFHRNLVTETGYDSPSSVIEALEERGIGHWVLDWLRLDKPLIAAINGPAAGGGFCLALLHDLRVMAPRAFLTAGFTSIGLAPELGASSLLPRLIGQSRASELLLLDPRISADDALHIGLAHRVDEDPLGAAVELAERLCAQPPAALAATLRLLRASGDTRLDDQLSREYRFQQVLWESEEFRARIARLTGP